MKWEDTLIAHHAFASHFPQALQHVASMYADLPPWKIVAKRAGKTDEKGAWDPEKLSDEDLWKYNCLHGTARVVLADGSSMAIADIVRRKLCVRVQSCDAEGRIQSRAVVGWHVTHVSGQVWYRLRLQNGGRSKGLILTPDHKVYTTRGYVRADALHQDDLVATTEVALTKMQEQAILGTLLGDSVLTVSPTSRAMPAAAETFSLLGGHTTVSGLTQHKNTALRGMLQTRRRKPGGGFPSAKSFTTFRTRNMTQLRRVARLIYDDKGRRRIKIEALEALGAAGLAWWFMDDGFKQNGQRRTHNTGVRGGALQGKDTICLATCGFPREDIKLAAAWFRKNFGAVSIDKPGSLRFSTRATEKFCTMIAPYIPKKLRYKLPRQYKWPAFKTWWGPRTQRTTYCAIRSIKRIDLPRRNRFERYWNDKRYCITVAGNHNFFTRDGLVKNCLDVVYTARVWHAMQPDLASERAIYEQDKVLSALCRRMQERGFHVDGARRTALRKELQGRQNFWRGQISKHAGREVNPKKLEQIRSVLFGKLKAPVLFRSEKTGAPSSNNETLQAIALMGTRAGLFAKALLKWRSAWKLQSTYVDGIKTEDGRVHPSWRAWGTVTGRFSCKAPNLQNLKRGDSIRSMYDAGPGRVLVCMDAEQLEMRIAAYLSEDEVFIEACESGDLHLANAIILFGEEEMLSLDKESPEFKRLRTMAKSAGFAMNYGAEADTVHARLFAEGFTVSLRQVQVMLDRLHRTYHHYFDWQMKQIERVQQVGYMRSWGGRMRWLGYEPQVNEVRNFPVQSGAADLLNRIAPEVEDDLPKSAFFVAQVHDELVVDCPTALAERVGRRMKTIAEQPVDLGNGRVVKFPMEVKIKKTWGDKGIKITA